MFSGIVTRIEKITETNADCYDQYIGLLESTHKVVRGYDLGRLPGKHQTILHNNHLRLFLRLVYSFGLDNKRASLV